MSNDNSVYFICMGTLINKDNRAQFLYLGTLITNDTRAQFMYLTRKSVKIIIYSSYTWAG